MPARAGAVGWELYGGVAKRRSLLVLGFRDKGGTTASWSEKRSNRAERKNFVKDRYFITLL